MARRFGGVSPVYSYSVKLRWIVGALSSVVLVLLALLVSILLNSKPEEITAKSESSQAWATPTTLVRVMTARQNIELGMQIDDVMLQATGVSADNVPDGAIREQDRQLLFGKYAKQLIPVGSFISSELITNEALPDIDQIPPEMRAVTITLDSRSGVGWFIKAGSRVDVLLTSTEKGEKQVTPIVPFAKVFAVNGDRSPNAAPGGNAGDIKTVTLIVSELDSKKIELGRSVGTLSLTLVGATGNLAVRTPNDPVTPRILFPHSEELPVEEQHPGTMTWIDPSTGQRQEMFLDSHGHWKRKS